MPGPNRQMGAALAFVLLLLVPQPLLAYSGPGAGLELVGYFMGLLAWGAMVFGAVLMWPITALMRYFRGPKNESKADKGPGPEDKSDAAAMP